MNVISNAFRYVFVPDCKKRNYVTARFWQHKNYTVVPTYPRIQYPRFPLSVAYLGPKKNNWTIKEMNGS